MDEIVYGCQKENRPRHIAVMRNGHVSALQLIFSHISEFQVFRVPVLDKSGNPLSLEQLKSQFEVVISRSEERNPHPISIVSSDNRDKWAETYEDLKRE